MATVFFYPSIKTYTFTLSGKIKGIVLITLICGSFCGLLLLIGGAVPSLRYVVWLPIVWVFFLILRFTLSILTVHYDVDNDGITMRATPFVPKRILWKEIEEIVVTRNKSKIIKIDIFLIGEKRRECYLDSDIANSQEFFATTLAHVVNKVDRYKTKLTHILLLLLGGSSLVLLMLYVLIFKFGI